MDSPNLGYLVIGELLQFIMINKVVLSNRHYLPIWLKDEPVRLDLLLGFQSLRDHFSLFDFLTRNDAKLLS